MSVTQSTVSAQDLFMMFLSVGSSMPGPFVAPLDRSSEARALFEGLAVNGTIAFSLLEDGSVAVRFGLQFADPNAIYGIYLLRKPIARYSPVSPVSPAPIEPSVGESTEIVYKNRRITICWEASPTTAEKQQQEPTSSLPDTSPYIASDSYTVACNDLLSEQEQLLAQYASLTPPLDEYTPPTPPNAQYEQSQQQFEFHQQQQQQQHQLQQLQQQQEQQQREQMELEQLQVMPENVLYDLTPYLFEQCSTGCPSVIQDAYGIHALASREIVIKRNDRVIARSTVMKVFN